MGDIDIYIVSVNVGKKTVIPRLGGGNLATGINKQPVSNAVDVDELGLVDDNVCNTIHHGGLDQAVYLYRQEDYDYWSQVLKREIAPGTFGENLTVIGLPDPFLAVGDEIVFSDLRLQVTAPRIPCNTLASKMGDKLFPKKFISAALPGIYCRVLETGSVAAGESFTIEQYDGDRISTVEFFKDWLGKMDTDDIRRYLDVPIDIRSRRALLERLCKFD